MPTAVSLARQCLAPDAGHALDEAVAVARRRGHAQTTSLHAISALLSLPSSALRDACARARKTAYSPRLQFKALELCLSVSLDRVPSTQLTDDPPVSNSLMAAIKRSQANQRRQPENFHLYHQLSQQSSIACVKVELQHFILSILDDPVVSRVFGEAGFRSSEIKLAIIRPFPQLLRYSSRTRGPPLFLCNLMDYSDPSRRGFLFPLSGFRDGDENNRRIGEVLGRNRGRNPLLVGVSAYVALENFTEAVEKRNDNILPEELSGLRTICLGNDFSRFLSENSETGSLNMRFVEVVQMVEQSPEPGLIVNFGDLKAFVGDNSTDDRASHIVGQLKRLVDLHGEKIWLIGAAASYETYLRFVTKFPSIEKDWDLHLLPITSLRPCVAESYPRSSLMGSFVPLGGFFSTPSDASVPLSGSCHHSSRCHQCDKNCEEEVIAASKGVFTPSLSEQYQSSLPSWMQMAELGNLDGFDTKTRDDGLVLSAKIAGFQKKWDNVCQRLHHSQPLKEATMFPTIVGFQVTEDKRGDAVNNCSSSARVSSHKDSSTDLNSCNFIDLPKISLSRSNTFPLSAKANNENFLSKLQKETSKTEVLELGGRKSPFSLSISSVDDENRTSSPSAGSVTTDLGLGIVSLPTGYKLKKPLNQNCTDFPSDLSGCCSTNVDLVNGKVCNGFTPSSSCSSPEQRGQMNAIEVKTLFRLLKERVFWQDQAVSIVSQTISQCQTRTEKRHGSNLRGDIWFNFVGPDRFGKKKVAIALAEILYGNKDQFICVDLSSQDGMINTDTILGCPRMRYYNVEFRGKTVLDFIAAELSKQPLSIVLLENVDKADLLDQNRLSQAIQTGKLSDLQGREVSIKNAIFVTTSTSLIAKQGIIFPDKKTSKYSEERLLKAKSWPLQIDVDSSVGDQVNRNKTVGDQVNRNKTVSDAEKKSIPNPIFMNKRKLNVIDVDESSDQHEISEMVKRSNKMSNRCLDLNRPAEENAQHDIDGDCRDNDTISEISKTWLRDFCNYIDQVVVFKPFDFDALAEKILKDIKKIFHTVFGSEYMLEIDSKVMEQLLAAAYNSYGNREVDDWMEQVLSRKFSEVKRIHILSAYSVVKLSTCDQELALEEKAAEVCLPRRIVLDPESCSS